jgi:hypothetical protein
MDRRELMRRKASMSVEQNLVHPVGPPVSMSDIIATYPDEWILLRVTAYDEDQIPSEGYVVGHWPATKASDRQISRVLEQVLSTPNKPEMSYYLFQACDRVRTGDELRRVLAAAAADEGAASARWQW